MKCLQVNKFWYRRAGADIYAIDLASALLERGHEIRVLATRHPSNVDHPDSRFWPPYRELSGGGQRLSYGERARAVVDLIYNRGARRALDAMLAAGTVDVAHVHNFSKHLSPAPLLALRERGIPLVATLHDHWPTCPTYSLLHGDGTRCEWECARKGVSSALRHACVAGSIPASGIAAVEAGLQRKLGWGLDLFDLIISPSQFLANSLEEVPHPKDRVRVIPHPRPRYPWTRPPKDRPRVLYVGRLAREKGVDYLINAARGAGWQLDIAGRGPFEDRLHSMAAGLSNVRFLGMLSTPAVIAAMQASHIVAVPSIWYENAPLVVLEALAVGRVIVASNIGGIPEYLQGAPWAALVSPGDAGALRDAIDRLTNHRHALDDLGRAAWEASEAAPGWPEHAEELEGLYRGLVA